MLDYDIESIVGSESIYAKKLRKMGIASAGKLLEEGCDRECRKALAKAAEVDESLIFKWVNRADILRVWGIGHLYADLLELAGVTTLTSLQKQNAKTLHSRLSKINLSEEISIQFFPGLKRLESWINEAKSLNSIITP